MNERRPLILDVGVRMVFHTILLFALFLLFAGHNAPGGGFVAGLVAGAAFVLRDIAAAYGAPSTPRSPMAPETVLGGGLLVAVATGVVALLAGHEFLESGKVELDLPVLGILKITSALAFDIGVFLVVLGVVLTVVHRLGEDDPT